MEQNVSPGDANRIACDILALTNIGLLLKLSRAFVCADGVDGDAPFGADHTRIARQELAVASSDDGDEPHRALSHLLSPPTGKFCFQERQCIAHFQT